jgi:hypothetical protein
MSRSNPVRSYIKFYWLYWAACVALVLTLRFTAFAHSSGDARFALGVCFALFTWLSTGLFAAFEAYRLFSYLHDNYRALSDELYFPSFDRRLSWALFRWRFWIRFQFSKRPMGEPVVDAYRHMWRQQAASALVQFLLIPVIVLAIGH